MTGVDDYWAKLKAATAPAGKLKPATIVSVAQNPGKTRPTSSATLKDGPTPASVQQAPRILELLKSDTTSQRLSACKALQVLFRTAECANTEKSHEDIVKLVEGSAGKALLRRLPDTCQGVREAAAAALLAGLEVAPEAVLALLPYAVPVLEERLAWQDCSLKNPVESCEEVRLLLAQLVHRLVMLGGKALTAYGTELVGFLQVMLADPFHEVNMLGCSALVDLNAALGLRLAPASKQLVAAALPLTTHHRHKVRCAAVRAVRATMHQNAHEMILEMIAWRDPNVVPIAAFYGEDLKVNFAGKLATDPHPLVRLEWVLTLRDWMMNLRERIDHEPRLLPYLLSALHDESAQVSEAASETLNKLGAQYEEEHRKEVEEAKAYLPPTAQTLGWAQLALPGLEVAPGPGEDAHKVVDGQVDGSGAVRPSIYLPPVPTAIALPAVLREHTWSLGSVRVVQGQAGRSLYALTQELLAWQADARRAAGKLLRTLLFFASDVIHQHVQTLIPALCRAATDPDVKDLVLDCVALIAAALPPGLILDLLLPRLSETDTKPEVQAGIVRLIAAVVKGGSLRPDLPCALPGLLDLFDGQQHSLMATVDTGLRSAAVDLLRSMLEVQRIDWGEHTARVLYVSLHLAVDTSPTSTTFISNSSMSLEAQLRQLHAASVTSQSAQQHPDWLKPIMTRLGFDSLQTATVTEALGVLKRCDLVTSMNPCLTAKVMAETLNMLACSTRCSLAEGAETNKGLPDHNIGTPEPSGLIGTCEADVLQCMCGNLPTTSQHPTASEIVLQALLVYCSSGALDHGSGVSKVVAQNTETEHQDGDVAACTSDATWSGLMHSLLSKVQVSMPMALVCRCVSVLISKGHISTPSLLQPTTTHQSQAVDNHEMNPGSASMVNTTDADGIVGIICGRACSSSHSLTRLQACATLLDICTALQAEVSSMTHASLTKCMDIFECMCTAVCERLMDSQVAVRHAACCTAQRLLSVMTSAASAFSTAGSTQPDIDFGRLREMMRVKCKAAHDAEDDATLKQLLAGVASV